MKRFSCTQSHVQSLLRDEIRSKILAERTWSAVWICRVSYVCSLSKQLTMKHSRSKSTTWSPGPVTRHVSETNTSMTQSLPSLGIFDEGKKEQCVVTETVNTHLREWVFAEPDLTGLLWDVSMELMRMYLRSGQQGYCTEEHMGLFRILHCSHVLEMLKLSVEFYI